MSQRTQPDDGTYWVVDGQPMMFDPPALTMELVLLHRPDARAEKCKRLSGAQWLGLVRVLEERKQ